VNGLLDGGESCGFCIFNNIAAGALHAISDERLLCERCAIVDIDVHHGNGTEEIVKKCHDPGKLFFFSIHLYDNDNKKPKGNAFQYKFYPGTGAEDDVAYNIINVALTPLWKEPQEKAAGNTHNTRQKTRSKVAASDSMSMDDSASDVGTPRDRDSGKFSDAESETASSNNKERSPPFSPGGQSSSSSSNSGRHAYRQAIQNRLLPALRAFNPDLILISAGFDAARADVGNARHERSGERMGLDLEPEDYAWTTRKVLEVADICCQGRVVSVLEGGYGRSPPNGEAALDRSNLAECAARHVHAMVDPYDCEGRFST
jgi:acetoin utilization deacetylase AcuC-like enzyme